MEERSSQKPLLLLKSIFLASVPVSARASASLAMPATLINSSSFSPNCFAHCRKSS